MYSLVLDEMEYTAEESSTLSSFRRTLTPMCTSNGLSLHQVPLAESCHYTNRLFSTENDGYITVGECIHVPESGTDCYSISVPIQTRQRNHSELLRAPALLNSIVDKFLVQTAAVADKDATAINSPTSNPQPEEVRMAPRS